jgi:transcriptional regulator with XRE-family HTH domain
VALNVRSARKAAGLSQEELAQEAEIDKMTYISQVERQQRNLTISVLARIARALSTRESAAPIAVNSPPSLHLFWRAWIYGALYKGVLLFFSGRLASRPP